VEIQALIFDLGNVIVRVDANRLRNAFVRTNPHLERLPIGYDDWPQLRDYALGYLTTDAFIQITSLRIGRDVGASEFETAWSKAFELNHSLARLIPALNRKYRLVLLSNTNESHWQYCKNKFSQVFRYFDVCLLSFELGRLKPDPEVIRYAAEKAGYQVGHCLFIDDSAEKAAAARSVGLQAIEYSGSETESYLSTLL
jgi:HAD superfamily hydrolase (TIGR01549 family)